MVKILKVYIPSFYIIAYDKIASHASKDMQISTHDAKRAIGHAYRLPKNVLSVILKEIENLGWLEWENRDLINLKKKPKNALENTSEIYQEAGMWR